MAVTQDEEIAMLRSMSNSFEAKATAARHDAFMLNIRDTASGSRPGGNPFSARAEVWREALGEVEKVLKIVERG